MRLHGNARTCLHSRLLIVERVREQGWTVAAAAGAAGVSERTAAKWLARYRSEGGDGLRDRSPAPHRIPRRTPAERVRMIELLRRLRMTAAEIAEPLRMPLSTVSAVLKRIGLGKRSRLEPFEPANRYECSSA
jgi:transposase